jgi:integrase
LNALQEKLAALIRDAGEIGKALTAAEAAGEDGRLSENSIADGSDGALPQGVRPMKRIHGPYQKRKKFRLVIVDCATGAQTYKSFKTKEEAEDWKKVLRREAIKESVEATGIKVGEAIEAYAEYRKQDGKRAGTIETTTQRMKALWKPVLKLPLALVTAKQGQRLYDQFCEGKTRRCKPPSGDTMRNTLSEARRLLKWAVKRGHCKTNVLTEVEGRGIKSRGKPQLEAPEARRWMATALPLMPTNEWVVACVACLLLGTRSSEIVNRQVRDFDRDDSTIQIKKGKTPRSDRKLAVPEILRPHLSRLAQGKRGDQYLFSYQGKKGTDRAASACRRLCRLTRDVPKVTPHGLRGSHASLAQNVGVTANVVAAALGHTSATQTLAAYTTPSAAAAGPQRTVERVILGAQRERFPAVSRPTDPAASPDPRNTKAPDFSGALLCEEGESNPHGC